MLSYRRRTIKYFVVEELQFIVKSMKAFLTVGYYEETYAMVVALLSALLSGGVSRADAVNEFNNILLRVNNQSQVDQWKKQEYNYVLYPDTAESTYHVKEKLTTIRDLIRGLIISEMSVDSPLKVIDLLLESYVRNYGYHCGPPGLDKRDCLSAPLHDVVKGGLQQLTYDYEFEVTVNYFCCNKLLELKRQTVKSTIENVLGISKEELRKNYLA